MGRRENEIESSPTERMRPPIVPEEPPAVLRQTELRAISDACSGSSFEDRRDAAISQGGPDKDGAWGRVADGWTMPTNRSIFRRGR